MFGLLIVATNVLLRTFGLRLLLPSLAFGAGVSPAQSSTAKDLAFDRMKIVELIARDEVAVADFIIRHTLNFG